MPVYVGLSASFLHMQSAFVSEGSETACKKDIKAVKQVPRQFVNSCGSSLRRFSSAHRPCFSKKGNEKSA